MAEFCYHGKEYHFICEDKRLVDKFICPICQEILYEPVQTSCGHLFCGQCLEGAKVLDCPSCRTKFEEEPRRDRFNEREIKNLTIKCRSSSRGCQWEGELGNIEAHQNEYCEYHVVMCINRCGQEMERRYCDKHIRDECQMRPYHCPYCPWYSGTYQKVVREHLKDCSSYPLDCPNSCGVQDVKRGSLSSHLAVCPEEVVPCRYQSLGCKCKLPRKQMKQHLEDKSSHLEIAMTTTSELVLEQHKLRGEYADLKNTICQLQKHMSLIQTTLSNFCPSTVPRPSTRWWLKEDLPPCYPPCTLKVVVDVNGSGRSPPFISQPGGYKLVLLTYEDDIYSMEVLDEDCNYPLRYPVTFVVNYTLLNQDENKDHFRSILEVGIDCPQKNHGAIYLNCFNSDQRYYKNNTLYIKVDYVDTKY